MPRIDDDWYVQCECTDCRCFAYVNITQADEDGDYLRLCNDCIFGNHPGQKL